MKETAVEAYLFDRVRGMGGMAIKLLPMPAGIPDRLVILPGGIHYFVELKQPKGKRSPIQIEIHRRLVAIGHPVATLFTKQEVDLWLEFR